MVVEPILEKIGPTFRKNASKVVTLLLTAEAKQIEKSLKEKGYYDMESFKILPEHIKLVRKKEEETGRRFIPHVVEPSFGIDRLVYVVLEFAYNTKENRTLLKLPRDLAPVQAGVYPLVIKDGIAEKAQQLHGALMKEGFLVEYDEAGSIGRRYARADEVGTPLCITIDYQTLENNTVTIRDRDSWDQIRIDIEKLPKSLWTYFYSKKDLKQLGE